MRSIKRTGGEGVLRRGGVFEREAADQSAPALWDWIDWVVF